MPTVSVVIPTYYRNELLKQAIESALRQTHPPTEIIVVDDSGERHAENIANQYDDGVVTYVAHDENRGSQQARETGVEMAGGDYLQFLDDDDTLLPHKFELQLSLLTSTNHRTVYGGLTLEDGRTVLPQDSVRGDVLYHALTLSTWPWCIGTMLIDRPLYNEIRPIENKSEDARMRIELARRTTVDAVDEPVITIGTDTETSLSDSAWKIEGMESILSEYASLYQSYPEAYAKARGHLAASRARYTRKSELGTHTWSWQAIRDSFVAAWVSPEHRVKYFALALATLGGQPGLQIGKWLFTQAKDIYRLF